MNLEDPGSAAAARVLVVDDDAAMRELCAINLQLAGIAVLQAADGKRALALARAERPDLVLTDVKMPELGGFELAEALARSRRTRQIPLIFLSGETAGTARARARSLGAFAFVAKPFDPTKLASLVADALASRRSEKVRMSQPAPWW